MVIIYPKTNEIVIEKINLQLNLLLFFLGNGFINFLPYLMPKKYPAESEVHTMINKKEYM